MAENVNSSIEEVFLAERIVDSGFGQQDGKRYYKVKWVQYSWENEANIQHLKDLIDLFWSEHGEINKIKVNNETAPLSKCHNDIEKTDEVLQTKEGNASCKFDEVVVNNLVRPSQIIPDHVSAFDLSKNKVLKDVSKEKKEETIAVNTAAKEIETDHSISTTAACDINDVIAMKAISCMAIEKHECDLCLRKFDSLQSLKAHKRTHVTEKVFQCTTCLKCFGERSTLKRHMYIHLEKKPFKCEHCDRAFSDKSTLRRHTITHTGDKRFECDICKKRFTRNEHLRQHMYIHTSEKIYKCETCNKNFRQRSTLKNHMLLHRTTFKCERCGATFFKQTVYEKHRSWCNSAQNVLKQFKCEFCETYFDDAESLKNHEGLHDGDRPYVCIECNQSFAYKSILKRHMLTHVEKRKIFCFSCNKDFSNKAELIRHFSTAHENVSVNEVLKLNNPQANAAVPFSNNDIKFIIQNIDLLNAMQVSSANINDLGNAAVPTLTQPAATAAITESQSCVNIVPSLNQATGNTLNESALSFQLDPTHLSEESTGASGTLQPGDNQLLEVQIVRLKNGNQIVQSIHPMMTTTATGGAQTSNQSPALPTDIVDSSALPTQIHENTHNLSPGENPSIPGDTHEPIGTSEQLL